MDRVSGSGVFARDPDALLDLTQLEIGDNLIKQQQDEATCAICKNWISRFNKNIDELCSQDDLVTASKMLDIAENALPKQSYMLMLNDIAKSNKAVQSRTAWRIEGTLREFPKFDALNLWFDYPIHRADTTGVLKDCNFEGNFDPPYKKNFSKKNTKSENKKGRMESLMTAFTAEENNGQADINDIATYLGVTEKTVRNRLKEHGDFWIDGGKTGLKGKEKVE